LDFFFFDDDDVGGAEDGGVMAVFFFSEGEEPLPIPFPSSSFFFFLRLRFFSLSFSSVTDCGDRLSPSAVLLPVTAGFSLFGELYMRLPISDGILLSRTFFLKRVFSSNSCLASTGPP